MPVSGILQVLDRRGGFLRDPARSFAPTRQDVFVPAALIDRFRLVSGALVAGSARPERQGMRLDNIESICGMSPEAFRERAPFDKLTATNPDRRFHLGTSGNVSMRIIDLFAPIGRGTRGLIVSPPKAGKTTLLEELAQAILADAPDTGVMVLLVDERPEEVTHFRRQVAAEVLASSSDQSLEDHVQLATMCMDKARCELTCGRHVVVLVDSLTRMGRAFNSYGSDSGRTMSGGLDSRALEIPRKFFGMARNVEDGGSITILATALIETGARVGELILSQQLERVRPVLAQEPRDAPEDGQRLDRPRGLHLPHVRSLPAELIQDPRHGLLGRVVVAADEHGGLPALELGPYHEAGPDGVERLHEARGRK